MMKYTFEIEETLTRTISTYAENLADAMQEIFSQMENGEIVLDSSDFIGGTLRWVVSRHPWVEVADDCGEQLENAETVIVDVW